MDDTKSYRFIGFGDIHGPRPYKFIRFRWAFISQTPVLRKSDGVRRASSPHGLYVEPSAWAALLGAPRPFERCQHVIHLFTGGPRPVLTSRPYFNHTGAGTSRPARAHLSEVIMRRYKDVKPVSKQGFERIGALFEAPGRPLGWPGASTRPQIRSEPCFDTGASSYRHMVTALTQTLVPSMRMLGSRVPGSRIYPGPGFTVRALIQKPFGPGQGP
jgi:hypothetical protein